jgi:myo-inositol-1(or 4)-monophosphatase
VTTGSIPEGARELAVETALAAGAVLRERLTLDRTIDFKSAIDLVTDADRASEELIEGAIAERFPAHRFIGEETTFLSGGTPAGSELYSWLVDPLDGTTNYAHRYPHFAVSIALEHAGQVILGVVYDPMMSGSVKNCGAWGTATAPTMPLTRSLPSGPRRRC